MYPQNKDKLTKRERKGLNFERIVYNKIKNAGYKIKNRSSLGLAGCDFKIAMVEIEVKFSHARIFPCWIIRDWITRFSKKAKRKIVVVNRGIKLSKKALDLLRKHGIRLIYYDELLDYLSSLKLKDRGNHYLSIYEHLFSNYLFSTSNKASIDEQNGKVPAQVLVFKDYFIKFRTKFNHLCLDSLHVKSKINRGLDKMKDKYKEVINRINIIDKNRLYNNKKSK